LLLLLLLLLLCLSGIYGFGITRGGQILTNEHREREKEKEQKARFVYSIQKVSYASVYVY